VAAVAELLELLPAPELGSWLPQEQAAPERPQSERALRRLMTMATVPGLSGSPTDPPEPEPLAAPHCWPAGFVSCNRQQAAGLPGRTEEWLRTFG
jgi:hypothetical protein